MRETLKRVCVVFPEDLLQLADEYKDRYHGSRSQLLREALIEYVDRLEEEDEERAEMRPLVRRLEELERSVEKIDGKVTKYRKEIEFLLGGFQGDIPRATNDIERILLDGDGALTITEMGEYLPYEQNELIKGVEKLEENFAVERIEQGHGPPKWRIRGA